MLYEVITRLKIPAIFHEEAITGFASYKATTFPQQIGVACTWNPDLVEKNTATTAANMRAVGSTYALSPMLDLSRTAHWNRHQESYGEDAYLTSRMGVAFVSGLQGDDLKKGVAATVKHFAGYGTANNNDVITSYSIHYTKLYEFVDVKGQNTWFKGDYSIVVGNAAPGDLSVRLGAAVPQKAMIQLK